MTDAVRTGLTPDMIKTLDAIVALTAAKRRSPNLAELAGALGLKSKGCVAPRLDRLQARGYIARERYQAYSIRVLKEPECSPAAALPARTQALLDAYCRLSGEDPAAVIADAVTHHLDLIELDRGVQAELRGGGDGRV